MEDQRLTVGHTFPKVKYRLSSITRMNNRQPLA